MTELRDKILSYLEYTPLRGQLLLVNALANFVTSRQRLDAFLLNGYAGTGKTSIMGAFIKAVTEMGQHVVLLAPTGRAAKVASAFSGYPASTIHKRIFRADTQTPAARYFPIPNTDSNTLFIVDEASLITDNPSTGESLLRHLLRHVYSAQGCNIIFVGDTAQLPPVGQPDSPAMNPQRLRELGLNPIPFLLDEPARQARESGVLSLATYIRQFDPSLGQPPVLEISSFPDVKLVDSGGLADFISSSWSEVGIEETLVVTRSNYRANKLNNAIRNLVMMADTPLQRGDRIVISKNDYFWSKKNKLPQFIANGEIAIVDWVGKYEKHYGRFFAEVELTLVSDGTKAAANLMLRSLVSDGPSLSREEMNRFYNNVLALQEADSLSGKIKGVMEDPYYNALQAKYGYCVTCHKAQGGQWRHVYIDLGGINLEELPDEFYRWFYTALTRATEKVFLINPPFPLR